VTGVRFAEAELERLAHYVSGRTGLVFPPYRRSELERSLNQAATQLGASSVETLTAQLESDESSWDRLIAQVTIGETYFFREPEHFAFVRRQVLPQLLSLRSPSHQIRIWSAGCATGEETYSLAIVLQEHGLRARAHVLGTDLSALAIERATAGIYRQWSLRNLDPVALAPYFTTRGGEYRIRDEIREYVSFRQLNLAEPVYPAPHGGTSQLDLILCRNVFIYLDGQTLREIGERFFEALAPGGFLIIGPSDPLLASERFETITTPAGIFYRRPQQALARGLGQADSLAARAPPETDMSAESDMSVASARRAPAAAARPRRLTPEFAAPASAEEIARAAASVRNLANDAGAAEAEKACRVAIERAPLSVELHYLHALLLIELADAEQAVAALRRTLYLDGRLAIAHFTLGTLLARSGDRRGAERAFRNAEQVAAARPAAEALPLSDGLAAAGLALAARRELGLMAAATGVGQ
jgi:chemotaxis protein methyltransferase CheR